MSKLGNNLQKLGSKPSFQIFVTFALLDDF